jgi:peptide subunit release factor 1 (eRF1)
MTTNTRVGALEELLDRLAGFEPGDFPVTSLYLDTRPNAQGRDDFDRFLRTEFQRLAQSFAPQSPERASVLGDAERLSIYLQTELRPSANGVALFSCSAAGLFEAVQVEAPFPEHRLFVASTPHLYPLAHFLDHYRRYAAVVANTSAARIFVFGLGEPLAAREVSNPKVKRHKEGGWSQMRYQRHVDNVHLLHAKEVADVLTRLVRAEQLELVVVAGDDVIVPLLREHLPKEVNEKMVEVQTLDARSPEHAVLATTFEAFRRHDERSDAALVGRLLDEYRGGGLGVAGLKDVQAALETGQVDELVLSATPTAIQGDDGAPGDAALADRLVSRARLTSARVTFVEDQNLLADVGGVGALLRYRLTADRPVPHTS